MSPTASKPDLENATVTTLVTGIIHDAQELFKQQVELVKHEIRDDIRKTRDAGLTLGAGAGLSVVGAIFLTNMVVYLLHELGGLPLWGCYAITGGSLAVAGAGLLWWAISQFDSFNPLPEQSAKGLQENLQWITKSTNPK